LSVAIVGQFAKSNEEPMAKIPFENNLPTQIRPPLAISYNVFADSYPSNNEATLSDELLIEQILFGNAQAFSTLVVRYRERVFRIAKKMGFDREDSLGITQSVFLDIYRRLELFRGEAKFSTWIYTVARNRCINYSHKLFREKQTIKQSGLTLSDDQSPEDLFIQQENVQIVRKAIENINAKYRHPLVLYYIENKSYEQIAEALRIPLRTVETRLYRGRKLFKSYLQNSFSNQPTHY
jgi:RNA polymerase sigma-70 factor, ECF subfamily